MNKYNVPKKEYENVKQEMNSFSGGGDSDDSAEYYKCNHKINSESEFKCFNIVKAIIDDETVVIGNNLILMDSLNKTIVAGKWIKDEIKDSQRLYNNISFKDMFIKVLAAAMIVEDPEAIFNEAFTPITKEEFYDLNNI